MLTRYGFSKKLLILFRIGGSVKCDFLSKLLLNKHDHCVYKLAIECQQGKSYLVFGIPRFSPFVPKKGVFPFKNSNKFSYSHLSRDQVLLPC